jgi:hypothetical protein
MGFMDKVVSKARDVSDAGHAKVDNVQAKRQMDDLYRQVGALAYAARVGRATPQDGAQLEQAMQKLHELEEAHRELFVPGSTVPPADTSAGAGAAVPTGAGAPVPAGASERQYVPGVPAPPGLYPPGAFLLDELGYPKLSDIGTPLLADGTDASYDQLQDMGIKYPSPEDQRYWYLGIPSPWDA